MTTGTTGSQGGNIDLSSLFGQGTESSSIDLSALLGGTGGLDTTQGTQTQGQLPSNLQSLFQGLQGTGSTTGGNTGNTNPFDLLSGVPNRRKLQVTIL